MSQVDEQTVRRYAEAHGQAVVAGDTAAVLADIHPSLHAEVGALAARLGRPTSARVVSVEPSEDRAVVHIAYRDSEKETTLRSVWTPGTERPLITEVVPV